MAYDPDLLDQLENLGSETFSGEVFRYTGGRRRPDQENTVGARWNPPEVAAIYTALDLDTLMAEFEHHLAALSPAPKRDAFTLYSLQVEIENVVNLREQAVLAKLGVTPETLRADDQSACRRVGGAADWLTLGGILVPSARRPGGNNLVIFPHRQDSGYRFQTLSIGPMPPASPRGSLKS